MDVITTYLETMFSPYPLTPRLAEAKAELREMMEDAYQAAIAGGRSENEAVGQVITEFGNLDELAPVLGIAGDLNHNAPAPLHGHTSGTSSTISSAPPAYTPVTLAEAQGFSAATRSTQPILALAVALFVLSPTVLIALSNPWGPNPLSSEIAEFVGIACLLLLVLIGVSLMLVLHRRLAPYSRISEGKFAPDPTVDAWAQHVRAEHELRRMISLIIAISLWILSALPVIASDLLGSIFGAWGERLAVPLTLLMVAIGLLVFIPSTWADSVAQRLARGSENRGTGATNMASYPTGIRVLLALFWPLTVIVYLLWSFIGDAWEISWIIWPIAGLLFAAFGAVGSVLKKK